MWRGISVNRALGAARLAGSAITISRRHSAGREGRRMAPIKVVRLTSAATMPRGGGGRGARVVTLNSEITGHAELRSAAAARWARLCS